MTSARQIINPNDDRLSWGGAVSLERGEGYVAPWRIPFEERGLFHPLLAEKAAMAAGVRLSFFSETRGLTLRFPWQSESQTLDLVCDGDLFATVELQDQDRVCFEKLPEGRKLIELWLPPRMVFRLAGLEIDAGAEIAPLTDNRPRWIAYGSSITMASTSTSPTLTWPAIVARSMNLNLTCLGFGGQCHLDSMIARLIRDLPADHISICAGINIYGRASLGPRTFKQALIGTVKIIREKHPETLLTLQSPIIASNAETKLNAVEFTLQQMRGEVSSVVELLREHGDANIHYVDGRDILGEEHAQSYLRPDQVHPTAEGYQLMGRNFLEKVAKPLFKTAVTSSEIAG